VPHNMLIVDDHEPIRRRIRSLVESEGLHVCGEATNGREAIEKTKECMPDLAILNLSMPVMNGLETGDAEMCSSAKDRHLYAR
jgi:chemotaxis response regulator CheB